jgi:bifunctional UDP-N-acetylglucosamine pyrophosphorylase/glucosamine-1-phosphate N-acetyltransferase
MKSDTPKVMHQIAGRTIIGHVLNEVNSLSPKDLRIVVGHGREDS